jgi:EAL domain-containing protein (putative c-di-GMP-specific phosphodiesterase class I)
MAFQPIVDLGSREVIGLEALARFDALPYRSPDQWFEEAAAVGLGIELELCAVRRAAAELALLPPDVYLSVNVSPESAVHPDLADILAVAPQRFVVEVTEHAQVDDYDTLLDGLGRLRDRGVRLAIDDAGAGYSSLRHILRLQPDVIKLDIDLTRNIDIDPARRALAAAFVRFAEEIGSTITAEGVETEAELATLQDLQVGRGQGYLFGRPGPLRAAVRHDVGVGP